MKTPILLTTLITLFVIGCSDNTTKGTQNPSKNSLVNATPKALSQSVKLNEDTKVFITLKATDEDNDTLGYKVTSKPKHGKLKSKAPNITYTPNRDYNGEDSFGFIANDGLEDSNEATITLDIKPINDTPQAKDDKATLNEDTNITIDPLNNDSDVDIATNQDRLTITNITQPQNGKAIINNNKIIYTPNSNFNGDDTIEYTITDKNNATTKAFIDITINPVNDAPVAKDDNTKTDQAKAITIDPLSNDSDVDIATNQDRLTITEAKTTNNAKATIKDNTQIVYTPNKTFFGKDTITYTIQDKAGATATAKVNVDVKEHPYITQLDIITDKDTLNIDDTATLQVIATYSNNTTTEIDNNIEWIITPKEAIQINKTTLTAIKDTNVTIQAKVTNFLNQTITSNKTNLNIYWEVNGHRLPPEPDPKVNNSTLLGIDSNNNGVRDDVERWIYEEYKDKHPIYAAIAMEAAKAYQLSISGEGHYEEAHKLISDVIGCESYYMYDADEFKDPLLISRSEDPSDDGLLHMMMNTQVRINAYADYDHSLSGRVFGGTWPDEDKRNCPASIKEVLK